MPGRLLHGPERGPELGIARRGGGVEVDAVRAHLPHLAGHVDHLPVTVVGGFLLGGPGLVGLTPRQKVGGIGQGTVGAGVEGQVGHGSVVHGHDRTEKGGFHGLLLEGDDGPHRLERIIRVTHLHGIHAEGPLVDADTHLPAHGYADPARTLSAVECVHAAVVG